MNSKSLIVFTIPILVVFGILMGSLFVVQQTQQTLILEFGKLVRVIKDPGLYVKIPFLQNIQSYDNRILDFDLASIPATLADQKRLLVDTFARYRIIDPALFYRTVQNVEGAEQRLRILNQSITLGVLGQVRLTEVLSPKRSEISKTIRDQMDVAARAFGIQVVDLQLRGTDLPPENSEAICNRMISERKQESQEFRSRGDEMAQEIKSTADKERTIILAEATKQSEIIRGQGDAYVTEKAASIYGKDIQFYDFYRSLNAYKAALNTETTTFILSPKDDFFKYLNR
ncbi:MAG: protease modulator HflC [Alphaproteobacteria bacterium]|jgi:membrane protease subunit HflC|nr:protease modulator HflC [Alphaproteobacteria bacterium]MBP9777062.1 protease modulator HflC [Alphaproteobacteria bacterium]